MNKVYYLSVNIWVYFLSIDQKFELVTIIVTMAVTSASVWCVSWHQDQEKFNWPAPGAWWPVDHWQVTAQQSPRHWLVSNTSLTARTNGTISNYREKNHEFEKSQNIFYIVLGFDFPCLLVYQTLKIICYIIWPLSYVQISSRKQLLLCICFFKHGLNLINKKMHSQNWEFIF